MKAGYRSASRHEPGGYQTFVCDGPKCKSDAAYTFEGEDFCHEHLVLHMAEIAGDREEPLEKLLDQVDWIPADERLAFADEVRAAIQEAGK